MVIECIKKADPSVFPAQILSLSECTSFTKGCEEAITQKGLGKFKDVQKVVFIILLINKE
jgi:hypothetical protein